jgi:small subunit ribosomal protein S1
VDLQDIDRPQRAHGPRGAGDEARYQRGTVVGLQGDDVFVELGPRMQGVAPSTDFEAEPKVGDVFEFVLHGRDDDLWVLRRRTARPTAPAVGEDVQPGALVVAKISGQNTGGLEAKVAGVSAFLPASQVSLHREDNLAQFLGQNLTCEVIEVDRERKRIVLSRRRVLERERETSRQEAAGRLTVGQTVQGKVVRVEPFGAFVDLGGGLEGMIHVSNIAHKRVEKAGEALQVGAEVQAQVLKIEEGGKRIGLGIKQLLPDPWSEAQRRYPPDTVLNGRVTKLMEFGAFVELEPGVEGLVHVSQLSKDRVRRPSDVVKPGQEIAVRILAVEPARSRISLSRMDSRGALLGSEESVDAAVIDQALEATKAKPLGTNLGALFKKARENPDRR